MRYFYALILILCCMCPMMAQAQSVPSTKVPVCSGDWYSLVDWATDAPAAIGSSSNITRYGITTTIDATNSPNKSQHNFSQSGSHADYGGSPIIYAQGVDFDINFSKSVSQIRFAGMDLDGNESLVIYGELNGIRISPSAISGPSSNPMDLSQLASGEVIAQRSGTAFTNQGWADNAAIIGFDQPVDRIYISIDNRKNAASTGAATTVLGDVQTCADFTDAPSTHGNTFHNTEASIAFHIGASVSGDAGAGNSANASSDDDNGITMPSSLVAGTFTDITVNVTQGFSNQGFLQGWIDWNGDGDFTDSGEHIAKNYQYSGGSTGNIVISVAAPFAATGGQIIGRFRWSTTQDLNSIDFTHDGEVEDVAFTVATPSMQSCAINTTDPYADYVLFHSDNPLIKDESDNSYMALGAPDQTSGTSNYVSVGVVGESLILGFNNNFISNSGDSAADLKLYEIGGSESSIVALYPTPATKILLDNDGTVTPDPDGYYALGTVPGLVATADIDAVWNNGFIANQLQFTAIKMTTPSTGATGGSTPGPDIDAVEALINHDCSTLPASLSDPDRSDAPIIGTSYGEAKHLVVANMRLGTNIDRENVSQASANADGDDNDGLNDDDGVDTPALARNILGDFLVTITQPSSGAGYLQGWVDWNNDGDFTDNGEQIASNVQYNGGASGTITVPVTPPLNAHIGTTFTRFRWSTTSGLGSTGSAADGEVEDYKVTIHKMKLATSDVPICTGEWHSIVNWETDAPASIGATTNFTRFGIATTVTAKNAPANLSRYYNPNSQPTYGASYGHNPVLRLRGTGADVTFSKPISQIRFYMTDLDANESAIVYGERGGMRVSPSVIDGPLTTTPMYKFEQSDGLVIAERKNGNTGNSDETRAVLFGFSQPVDFIYFRLDKRRYSTYNNNGTAAVLDIQSCADFTDAPTTYGDTFHNTSNASVLHMGGSANSEAAPGDDANAASDDDNGVTLPTFALGSAANITVNVSQVAADTGYLQGWIDWNGDGDFDDGGEQVASDMQYSAGTSGTLTIAVTVPANATQSPTFGRFRWSTTPGLDSATHAVDGEVEDVSITIVGSPSMKVAKSSVVWDPSNQSPFAMPGNDMIYTITTTNDGDAPIDADSVFLFDSLPSDVIFYNGDVDGAGPETDPIAFADINGSGLGFSYSANVAYSNASTVPSSLADCTYTPNAGYDPAVKFICINPSGAMDFGDPDPNFTVKYRVRIK